MSSPDLAYDPVEFCPLCGQEGHEHYDSVMDTLCPEINRYLPSTESPLPPVTNTRHHCRHCGLIYLSPRLDSRSLSNVYRLWYGYAYRAIFADASLIARREREFARHHLPAVSRWAGQPGRLLDVGCGSGLFLNLARQAGWKGTGIEFDAVTADWGRRAYGLDVRCGTLHDALADGETFHAITLFDYLEHSPEPGRDLDALISRLEPGGLLFIRVPNQAGWQSRLMGASWLAVMCNHLSYFSPKAIQEALEARGLRVEEVSAHNYQSEWDILAQRLGWLRSRLARRRAERGDHKAAIASGFPVQRGLLAGFGRLAYSLLIEQVDHIGGWLGQGNHLMTIARKD